MGTHYEDEKKGRLVRIIKDSIINIIVVGIALAYILFQQIALEAQEVDVLELLGTSALGIICGVMIKQGLGENGFTKGYASSVWEEELKKYNEACNGVANYMERTDNFYYYEEIEKRKKNRRAILMGVRLRYSDFFDEEENFIGEEKMKNLAPPQKKAVDRCVRLKIYNLDLFSEFNVVEATDTHKEKTDKDQRVKVASKNSISAILVAIAGAYFIPNISGWSWANFIMATLQVAMWCASGIMQLYTNYNYVTVDKVNKLKKKKEGIQKFKYGCENGMYTENPYEIREKAKKAKEEAETQAKIKQEVEEQVKVVNEGIDLKALDAVKTYEEHKVEQVIEIQPLLVPGTPEYEKMLASL